MIFFGHIGVTTGICKAYEKIVHKENNIHIKPAIDYRIVLIGSILPDIVDKPIGAYFFRSTFHNSRIFGHTLIVSLILVVLGLYMIYKERKNKILTLGMSTSIHLILDSMWLYKGILFWPYYGLRFPERPEGNWVNMNIVRLFTDPSYYGPEVIGFFIIAYYFSKLIKKKQLKFFITEGRL
ncbi:LexA-binding, inner membrane-associated putative hydrolase [Clostridium cavendishii DSM 21758]|uniref:LexA-binding, inner membrane-associated putative hydrolase n=1 Tax=Clostridium cavendishii DSM 21758 TaxID=1121302 RepID=A0A1M6RB10_9CLOT|nr:metal-dependent hydrolase [Clostridium cavendishii]SHK29616.1 LexA-binding, inner membrane-associated putative hydrolase [Clostridium cavendishii DSM 21758]